MFCLAFDDTEPGFGFQLGKGRRSVADEVRSAAPARVLVERVHPGTRGERVLAAEVVRRGADESNSGENHTYQESCNDCFAREMLPALFRTSCRVEAGSIQTVISNHSTRSILTFSIQSVNDGISRGEFHIPDVQLQEVKQLPLCTTACSSS
jgi:hypothetical protein